MTYQIYVIKHLDTDKKYVGITSGDLKSRWKQHCADRSSAVYQALRDDGHRMVIEHIDIAATKDEALRKEQAWIQKLNTDEPYGWNRAVFPSMVKRIAKDVSYQIRHVPWSVYERLVCPKCGNDYTHQTKVEIWNRDQEDADTGTHCIIDNHTVATDREMSENPSQRRQGMKMFFTCESCHGFEYDDVGEPVESRVPPFFIAVYQHKGITYLDAFYYEEIEK